MIRKEGSTMSDELERDVESLKKDIEKFKTNLGDMFSDAGTYSKEKVQETREKLQTAMQSLQTHAANKFGQAEEFIQEKGHQAAAASKQAVIKRPFTSVAASFFMGFLTSRIIRKARHG